MASTGHDVDIIIPAFNASATLAETIDSAAAQSDVAHRITVIDDGSNDDTRMIAEAKLGRAAVLSSANQGVSAARNWGVEETSAEWIQFVDSDDLLLPGTLRSRLLAAREHGADAVICDWKDFPTEGGLRSVSWEDFLADTELGAATTVWAPPAAILWRRSLVQKIGGFRADLPVIQDARFLFDAAALGARFCHAPHLGAMYRVSPGSLSRQSQARFWLDVLKNGAQIEAAWRARGALSQARRAGVASIYASAARGLFRSGQPEFFEALGLLKSADLPTPLATRIAGALSRRLGLTLTRSLMARAMR